MRRVGNLGRRPIDRFIESSYIVSDNDYRKCGVTNVTKRRALLIAAAALLLSAVVPGCGSDSNSPSGTEAPVATEDSPPGDIPDNQVFVSYHSSGGRYTLDTPEGWARTESGANVTFSDKLHRIAVDVSEGSTPPTVESITAEDIPPLAASVEAFENVRVESVNLPSGLAVLVRYRENSAPDSVSGKKVRLETDRYEYFKDGKLAVLSLSAPAGSDNVDVWRQISRSFTWDG